MKEKEIEQFIFNYLKDNLEIEIETKDFIGSFDEDGSGTNVIISLWVGEVKITEKEFGIDK